MAWFNRLHRASAPATPVAPAKPLASQSPSDPEMRFLDLKDNLEHGDSSIADILIKGATLETDMRKYIGDWLRDRAQGRYAIPQEEELADDAFHHGDRHEHGQCGERAREHRQGNSARRCCGGLRRA